MTDVSEDRFDARVSLLLELAAGPNPRDTVSRALTDFEERAYLLGQYSLIDAMRRELDLHDLRKPHPADKRSTPEK